MDDISRNKIDWAVIRVQFETGEYSTYAIAREHGIARSSLQYRIKADRWQIPKAKVAVGDIPAHPPSALDRPLPASNLLEIDDNLNPNLGKPISSVARTPTDIVADGQAMILRLLSELDASTANIGELHELIDAETSNDRDNRRRDAMRRAVNLSSRSTIIKNLAAAAKALEEVNLSRSEKKIEAAKKAAQGVFTAGAAPRLVVDRV